MEHPPSKIHTVIGALIASLVLAVPVPASAAWAATATATLTAGSLAFVTTPPNVTFAGTLTGHDLNLPATQLFDVSDATGSGVGWNITATSTTFTSGSHTLPTSATTIASAPAIACDAASTCTLAVTNVTYPYTLPAAVTAPTATKMFNATAVTGMGDQTATASWNLFVPGNTTAGVYTSTWTFSLVSAP
jgi:hypothetical protein